MSSAFCITTVWIGRHYNVLLANHSALFQLNYAQSALFVAIAVNIAFLGYLVIIYTLSYYIEIPRLWIAYCVSGLPAFLYILDHELKTLRRVYRHVSISYIMDRHINITRYNAEVVCDAYGLSVFPVKTYERLYSENPSITLADLTKELEVARNYVLLLDEVQASRSQINWLRDILRLPISSAQC